MKYDQLKIEKKWIEKWEKEHIYAVPTKGVNSRNKCYVLPQLPYPSGSGLHVGHASVYTAADVFARYKRMSGSKVLQVAGWDSFGLPAENYAIKNNVHPNITTADAIDNYKGQVTRMGISVDWEHEVASHKPDYYKWTQWFFLLMYEQGLAYRKKQRVNWCPSCKTVLANDQVKDGHCERCDTLVEQKEKDGWFLKITDYADRLDKDLDKVDWPEESKVRQRNWIGKSEGAVINFIVKVGKKEELLEVFTTRPDTIFGVTFIALAPEHGIIEKYKGVIKNHDDIQGYIKKAMQKTDLERQQKSKVGVKVEGLVAWNPVSKKTIPVFIADYVLKDYGSGAIMGVPAHDERDFHFAKENGIDVIRVMDCAVSHFPDSPGSIEQAEKEKEKILSGEIYSPGEGVMINSGFLNGEWKDSAISKVIDYIEKGDLGKRSTTYRLRDWSVSRQRFWGAPIPMVYDPEGNIHPVKPDDLPVLLPDDVDFMPTGQSPLTYSKKFQEGVEEKYGKGWKREVETLDTFMCSSWYHFRYIDPKNDKAFASEEMIKRWMPVDFYLGGPEHVTGHLLYARFFTKVLYDAGYIEFDEPYLYHRHQGMILGPDNRKMSKRYGNVVNPTEVMDNFGADTLRLYEMFMGPLEETKVWSKEGVQGVYRFLNKVWRLQNKVSETTNKEEDQEHEVSLNRLIKKVGEDIEKLSFNTSIAKFMEFVNLLTNSKSVSKDIWEKFLITLAPFAPFITEELWEILGNEFSIHQQSWPEYDKKMAEQEKVVIGVQVNGKVRGDIEVNLDEPEETIRDIALEVKNVKKHIGNKEIKKFIYIPGKIVNIVI